MAQEQGPGRFSRSDRSLLSRLNNVVAVTDVMAIMMVVATVLSAWATWRAAKISNLLFVVSQRPYIGVERVVVEAAVHGGGRVIVDYRNFGQVPAIDTVVTEDVIVNGKPVGQSDERGRVVRAGVISPNVPNHLYCYLEDGVYHTMLDGTAPTFVTVNARYRGPAGESFCVFERLAYDARSGWFGSDGGSTDCSVH